MCDVSNMTLYFCIHHKCFMLNKPKIVSTISRYTHSFLNSFTKLACNCLYMYTTITLLLLLLLKADWRISIKYINTTHLHRCNILWQERVEVYINKSFSFKLVVYTIDCCVFRSHVELSENIVCLNGLIYCRSQNNILIRQY